MQDPGRKAVWAAAAALVLGLLLGCQPSDRTPGQWLRGTPVDGFPADWRFTDAHAEIFVEVGTPWRVPHSVTIWCAQVEGQLFIGARNAAAKRWPGWMARNRDIRLKISEQIYDVKATPVSDAATLAAVRAAYARKYALGPPGDDAPPVSYWAIVPRDAAQ
ncbi:MAG: DUF2255 family protein [Gammaproteobacteria bacterium]